jgi:hypothetical protein
MSVGDMTWRTRVSAGLRPLATTRVKTSLSVTIPCSTPSDVTTRLLMPCSVMRRTAFSIDSLGPMDTTSRIIASCTLRDRNFHR